MTRIPEAAFLIMCCPRCHGSFPINREPTDVLRCESCDVSYPVIEGIPVLLTDDDDQVSKAIRDFYESQWSRDDQEVLKAKTLHEDTSTLGQAYINRGERPFLREFADAQRKEFFIDAGSGAQPRAEFAAGYRHHVCLDFSLPGLLEAKRALGDRAIYICGSLLAAPIQSEACDAILASHVIYHIDLELQERAIQELARMVRPGGKVIVFYCNPRSAEALVRKAVSRLRAKPKASTSGIYAAVHSVDDFTEILGRAFGPDNVRCRLMRLFTKQVSRPLFKNKLLGHPSALVLTGLESMTRRLPQAGSYVAYLAQRPN